MLKPYYSESGITIYCGDCREILPELSGYDVIITDPIWPNNKVEEFKTLWDKLNAKRGYGWDVNPWVWVISFKRIEA